MYGDLVLINGRILTMDPARPEATAVAIRAGRVVYVGDDADARRAAGDRAFVMDLGGKTATPGLYDAHTHPMALGLALADLNLASPPNESIADLVGLVGAEAMRRPAGSWIVGRGYDQARLREQRHPNRHDIDSVAPNHPVLLIRTCHHIGVANSRALALAGITAGTPDPEGGTIDRDEHGDPTGVLREAAFERVRLAMGEPDADGVAAAVVAAGKELLRHGVTSTVEAVVDRPEEVQAYQRLRDNGRLPVRTSLMMMIDSMLDGMEALGIRTGFGDEWLRIGPAKLFADGTIGGRTARMRVPYEGQAENVGLLMMPPSALKEKVLRAHRLGFQVAIHAIGDAAIDLVLDAYEEALRLHPRPNPRHRIEHCTIVDQATIRRIARLGAVVIAETSSLHYFRDAYIQNLGLERLRYVCAMKSFARQGVIAAASTDAPIVPISATLGLQNMLTRVDIDGNSLWPEECISLDEALRAYTVHAAYASFEDRIKGMLKAGMIGDVTVFETDIRSVDPSDLASVRVDYTVTDGNIVYQRT